MNRFAKRQTVRPGSDASCSPGAGQHLPATAAQDLAEEDRQLQRYLLETTRAGKPLGLTPLYWIYMAKFWLWWGCKGVLCEQSPALPHVRSDQPQLLQNRPATARAEPRVMLGVLWEGRYKEGKH